MKSPSDGVRFDRSGCEAAARLGIAERVANAPSRAADQGFLQVVPHFSGTTYFRCRYLMLDSGRSATGQLPPRPQLAATSESEVERSKRRQIHERPLAGKPLMSAPGALENRRAQYASGPIAPIADSRDHH